MPAADANLLIRLLTGDDAEQVTAICALIERLRPENDPLFVPVTVVLEIEWVLRSRYGFDKSEVLSAFEGLLESYEVEFQDEPVVEQAVALYRDQNADFADCLHVGTALQHLRQPLLTFDRTAATLPGAMLLE